MQNSPQLYLASQSPRRRELLSQLQLRFAELMIDFPEIRQPNEAPKAFALRMAQEKAQNGWINKNRTLDIPVLAADTIVVIDDEVLGKPRDRAAGIGMLQKLSGRSHQVLTAVAIQQGKYKKSILTTSIVYFRELTAKEIDLYWESGEPHDKAGAYGIQSFGAIFIKHLEGSYSGVMGLPLYETAILLNEFNLTILG